MGPQLPDTIHLICGDSVLLQRCSVQPGSHWTPAAVLSHPNATRPVAHPMQSVNLYLRDSSENILDSVFIQVAPFTTHPSRHYYSLCGYTGVIGTLLPPNASVHWEPAAGLDNPNLPNPTVTFSDTMFYVAYIDMPNCGVLTDTVFLNIDQKPLANAYYFESNPCEITFFNYSTCADELHWYFGDGDSTHLSRPGHLPGPAADFQSKWRRFVCFSGVCFLYSQYQFAPGNSRNQGHARSGPGLYYHRPGSVSIRNTEHWAV
jgi:hypothetical protein